MVIMISLVVVLFDDSFIIVLVLVNVVIFMIIKIIECRLFMF